MGNTDSSQGFMKDNESHPNVPKGVPTSALQRKGSSFLEEPVISKSTERGEAKVTVDSDNSENGREGHEDDSSNSNKLRYAVSEMQGWRSHMEDKHVLDPTLSSNRHQKQLLEDHNIFAVFDGHGGDFSSFFCGEHFVSTLTDQQDWKKYLKLSSKVSIKSSATHESVIGLQLLKSALTATFLALDAKLMAAQRQRRLSQLSQLKKIVSSSGDHVNHDVFKPGTTDHNSVINFAKQLPASMPVNILDPLEHSGSTGVVVLITPSHILCANAGDSRAVLSKKTDSARGDLLPLSFDHKPKNDVEACRVEKDGGFVSSGRVDGGLAVSRSFGDFGFKHCEMNDNNDTASPGEVSGCSSPSDPKENRVTAHPDILVHTREPSKDEFVVLACDGIWDRLTNRDCADLVRSLVHEEGETDVGLICEEVIDTALELDSRDNMTCCLVFFPAANVNQVNDTPNSDLGVMKRRIDRERLWGSGSTPAKRAQRRSDERHRKNKELIALQQSKTPKSRARRQRHQPGLQLSPSLEKAKLPRPTAGSSVASQHDKKHKASSSPPTTSTNISRTRNSKSMRLQVASSGNKMSRQ